jgi:protein-tyrosine phosphatase
MKFRRIINFRDIASTGQVPVKKGVIYRSANTDSVSVGDKSGLIRAGISSIIDLRAPVEFKKGKKQLDGIEIINLPLDFEGQTREKLIPLLKEKDSEGKILEVSHKLYLDILDASGPVLKELVATFLSKKGKPMLIHCQAGKDRTGVIVALIHLIAGTAKEEIIADYLRSNEEIIPYYRRLLMIRKVLRLGFFPMKKILFMIEVKENNMVSVLERVENHYGGIGPYLRMAGVSAAEEADFRKYLISVN